MSKAADVIRLARKVSRPTALQFIDYIFTGFIELHGDRACGDDSAVVGGVALLDGRPVTVIGIQKGQSVEENVQRNFGAPNPEGYRKALRLMKQAEKFGRPVITLINTAGAFCGVGAEERGQGEAIARNLYEMSAMRTPVLAVIIGEGGSGGALGLAVADEVWMLENAFYSILSPEGFASILWKDSSRADEAAKLMRLTAPDLLEMGVIERVIPETGGGAHLDFEGVAAPLKAAVAEKISELRAMDMDTLLDRRYARFRDFGEYTE